MPLIKQKIANLIGGVSRRSKVLRQANQAEAQNNGLTMSEGIKKRPPSQHVGQVTTELTGWDDAFVHIINRTATERYHVVVADGLIKIFDATNGTAVDVIAPNGTAYLDDPDNAGFRAVTVGDSTFIVNRGKVVAKTNEKFPAARNEALVYVRQADFSTLYRITINDASVETRTNDQNAPEDRQAISTDAVAGDLLALLKANDLLADFEFTLIGSTIHIIRTDGFDFDLGVSDGLADNGLKAIKGSIQAFEDLPARALAGIVVHVTGDVGTTTDDYYVKYDDLGTPGVPGVWRECPRPGTLIALDPETLPHRLTLAGQIAVDSLPQENLPATWARTSYGLPPPTHLDTWQSLIYGRGDGTIATTKNVDEPPLPLGSTLWARHEGSGAAVTMVDSSDYVVVPFVMSNLSALSPTQDVYAVLTKNGVVVDSRQYAFRTGMNLPRRDPRNPFTSALNGLDDAVVATNVVGGDVIGFSLRYGTPTDLSGKDPNDGGLVILFYQQPQMYYQVEQRIDIAATHTNPGSGNTGTNYPIGSTFRLQFFPGTNIHADYTVDTEASGTVAAIATGLSAAVNALDGFTVTTTDSMGFTFVKDDHSFVSVGYLGELAENTFHNDELNLTVDALIGSTLTNLSDGSAGIITGNTKNTITAVLSGGADNIFHVGDICGVYVDPDAPAHFVFDRVTWKKRSAGNTDVVTFPSFTTKKISDIFFYQNRLGMLCEENVFFSAAGDLVQLFRTTATQLLSDDVIDVRSAHADVTIFDTAFLWAAGLFVKSDNVWFSVSGQPALTPTTIRLDPVGSYPSSRDPRPVIAGRRGFFTRAKSSNTQVFEISLSPNDSGTDAHDITLEVPDYIKGTPVDMVGDSDEGFLALLTDNGGFRNVLYIYRWQYDAQGDKVMSSWSQWVFPVTARLLGLDMSDGVLGFLRKEPDAVYFEQLDLDLTPIQDEIAAYVDRRIEANSSTFTGGKTVYDLPYDISFDMITVNGVTLIPPQPVVVRRDTGDYYVGSGRNDAGKVSVPHDWRGIDVYIGQLYQFYYKPTQFYLRNGQTGTPETSGRTQVRYLTVFYKLTKAFTTKITALARTPRSYVTSISGTPADGEVTWPCLTENEQLTVELIDDSPGPLWLIGFDYEAWFTNRAQRL